MSYSQCWQRGYPQTHSESQVLPTLQQLTRASAFWVTLGQTNSSFYLSWGKPVCTVTKVYIFMWEEAGRLAPKQP